MKKKPKSRPATNQGAPATNQGGGRPPDVGALARRAEDALLRGDIDNACKLLARAQPPSADPALQRLRASAYTRQAYASWDKPTRAAASLERALESSPDAAELHRLYGHLLRRTGAKRRAVAELAEAQRLASDDAQIAYEAALTRLAAGQRLDSLEVGAALDGSAAHRVPALAAACEGDLPAAERLAATSQQPLDRLIRAVLVLAQRDAFRALPLLEAAAGDDGLPRSAQAYANLYLGVAHLQQRQFAPAAEALEWATALGLADAIARDHLAWAYQQLAIEAVLRGDLVRASEWFEYLAAFDGPEAGSARANTAYALMLVGQERARSGDYKIAATTWARALELAPRDVALRQNLAVALERAGRGNEAIPHWHELARMLPRGAGGDARHGGGPRNGQDDFEFRRHIRLVAHRHLADLYLEQDDTAKAIEQLERAVQAVPADVEVRRSLAELLAQDGQDRKAVAHYERVLADAPDNAMVHGELGVILMHLGSEHQAFEHLEKAVELEPENPAMRSALGLALTRRIRRAPGAPTAVLDALRALNLLADRVQSHGLVALGAAQLAQGELRWAKRSFRDALRAAANRAATNLEIGRLYWAGGHREAAAAAWTAAMKQAKLQPLRYCELAREWARAGDAAKCRECLEAAAAVFLYRDDVVLAVEDMARSRELLTLVRGAVQEIAASPKAKLDRVHIAELLVKVADPQGARALLKAVARDAVEMGDRRAMYTVLGLDETYRLLDHKSIRILVEWLDAHEEERDAIGSGARR